MFQTETYYTPQDTPADVPSSQPPAFKAPEISRSDSSRPLDQIQSSVANAPADISAYIVAPTNEGAKLDLVHSSTSANAAAQVGLTESATSGDADELQDSTVGVGEEKAGLHQGVELSAWVGWGEDEWNGRPLAEKTGVDAGRLLWEEWALGSELDADLVVGSDEIGFSPPGDGDGNEMVDGPAWDRDTEDDSDQCEGEAVDLWARARFSYGAAQPDELSFRKGDLLHLVWRDSWDPVAQVHA